MHKNKKNIPHVSNRISLKKGFSMVELLIVIAIMTLMTSVLFINSNEKKKTADLESVSRKIAAEIRGLQNDALAGKKFFYGTDWKEVREYNFMIDTSESGRYHLKYKDSSGVVIGEQVNNLTKKNVTFASGVDFYFKTPRAEVNPVATLPAAGYKIELQLNVGTVITRFVCISNRGSVTEEVAQCPWEI